MQAKRAVLLTLIRLALGQLVHSNNLTYYSSRAVFNYYKLCVSQTSAVITQWDTVAD